MSDIRLAETPAELQAVYRFRYAIYVDEMRRPQRYADHDARTITDPLDVPAVRVLAAWARSDGVEQIVGTVRYNTLRVCDIGEYADHYALAALPAELLSVSAICTRLMVSTQYRSTPLATRLSASAYQGMLEDGVTNCFIDCNRPLVRYFTGIGYRTHRECLTHPEYGDVVVMRLDSTDLARLEAVRSPLVGVQRRWNKRKQATSGEVA